MNGYLGFDDVIISVDLQRVSSVTGDAAACSVEVSGTIALHLCVGDHWLLTFDGIARVMDATEGL